MSSEFSGYEYGFGAIRGLRSFNVDEQGRLRGITFPAIWKPGDNTARCGLSTDGGRMSYATRVIADDKTTDGRCDNPDHGCGFWAFHNGSVYHTGDVHAVIEGSGKVTVGTKGFRCEKAKVVALYIPAKVEPKAKKAWWKGWPLSNAILATVLLLIAGANATIGNWKIVAFDGVLGLGQAAFFFAAWRRSRRVTYTFSHPFYESEKKYLSPELAAKVRRNYPDVEFFDSLKDMKAAYPVDDALEPSPENDPTFWDDDGTTLKVSANLRVNSQSYQASLARAMNQSINQAIAKGLFTNGGQP